MRILTTVLLLSTLLVFANCGEEPIGFNVNKEVPVELPVELEGINDSKLPTPGLIDPAAYSPPEQTFNLADVTADDSENIEVVIKDLFYQIDGVDSSEDFEMDEFTILVEDGNTVILELTIFNAGEPITNITKTKADGFDAVALTEALEQNRTITVNTVVDFNEIPDPIEFEFTFFFDVTAKIRN